MLQPEAVLALLGGDRSRLGFPRHWFQLRKIPDFHGEEPFQGDDLNRLAIANGEGGAKRLMAAHDLVEAALERRRIDRLLDCARSRSR